MAEIITVARPYAEAVFSLAKEQKRLDAWRDALGCLAAIMQNHDMAEAVTNPKNTVEEVGAVILDILGERADGEVRYFVETLVETHRLNLLPEIALQFDALKTADEGAIDALVHSAFPLRDDQCKMLIDTLSRHYGKTVRLAVEIDKKLIGGVRVRVGDEVIDASVRGKLSALAASLKN